MIHIMMNRMKNQVSICEVLNPFFETVGDTIIVWNELFVHMICHESDTNTPLLYPISLLEYLNSNSPQNYQQESIKKIKVMVIDDMRMVKYSIKMKVVDYSIDRVVDLDRRSFGI